MKTNPFDDAIRRKLESIEPPYREKDWVYMQSYMHQHGFPPAWTSWHGVSQWLLPATSALTVASLLIVTVWQYHTNQQLQQSVQQLTQTVNRFAQNQPQAGTSAHQTDTVYVTRSTPSSTARLSNPYPQTAPAPDEQLATLPVLQPAAPDDVYPSSGTPSGRQSTVTNVNRLTQRQVTDLNRSHGTGRDQSTVVLRPGRKAPTGDSPQEAATGSRQGTQPLPNQSERTSRTTDNGTTTTDRLAVASRSNEADAKEARRSNRTKQAESVQAAQSIRSADLRDQSDERSERLAHSSRPTLSTDNQSPVFGDSQRPEARTERQSERTIATPEALAGLPLRFDTAYYPERMARRARTIRSLLPRTPVAAKALEQKVARQAVRTGLIRIGLNGEAGTKQQGVGLYAEVMINRHWSIGLGLDQVHVASGRFITDYQFNAHTHHDFREEYAKGLDPRRVIMDINRRGITWQLPITAGYRIALGQGFTLIPSAGVALSLSAREKTTFSYQWTPKDRQQGMVDRPQPTDWYNAWTLAIGTEKQWKHWVVQAGPTLINPLTPTPDQINATSLGLRTRLLYQF